MKLLIFAHTPPPHHGQSYMVQLMLEGFGGDQRLRRNRKSTSPFGVACYHVNARVSKELEDIGNLQVGKIFLLFGYCLQAIWCRYRYGVTTLYYIPAPGKHSALYRDWFVMLLCRPFFKKIILHWHAAGLSKWLETHVHTRTRILTYHWMKDVNLSIVLSRYNRADAEKLLPKQIRVVNNGVPDPCADFDQTILPRRRARLSARKKLNAGESLTPEEIVAAGGDPNIFKVLYLAHCTAEKGLFDCAKGVIQANQTLTAQKSRLSIQLMIAGNFVNDAEKKEFDRLLATPEGQNIKYLGFVGGEEKKVALRNSDYFCFPTYYRNENQPVNLIEAMAFGLPILTTRWRSIPELFSTDYSGLVDVRSPEQIARALLAGITSQTAEAFREIFRRQFNFEQHLANLAAAFHSVEAVSVGAGAAEAKPATHPALHP
ncbi:MAG TPA: glycosyltransferase [Verrucomicrobiae bacterium]|jgi:glycosyltransferase involved in cell wall biosynthesis|nr:glycosyltransferase [Verrucomicrobiae bacterium]